MRALYLAAAFFVALFAYFLLAKTPDPQDSGQIESLESKIVALEATIGDLQSAIDTTATITQANDATLASWVEQVNTDIITLQVAVVENPTEVVELVSTLNGRLDELVIFLNGGQNAASLLESVDPETLRNYADQCVGGCGFEIPPASPTTTPPALQTPDPTPQVEPTALAEPIAEPTSRSFRPEIEQWRPLATEALATFGAQWAVDEMLYVIDGESDGCPTAAAFHGCYGSFKPLVGNGCQARGLAQQCGKYWVERATNAGLPECAPIEQIVDPECNLRVSAWLFTQSGCSWSDWPSTRPSWRRGRC